MNFPRIALTKLIRVYQSLTSQRVPVCRFDPTCSRYAIEAIEHHGAFRGVIYAVRRICRCHPWGGWGYDPVPAATQRVEA